MAIMAAVWGVAAVLVGGQPQWLAAVPASLYDRTAGALIATGVVAWLLPPADRALATGVAAAVVLWRSRVALVRGARG